MKKFTYIEVKTYIESLGYKLLSKRYISNNKKLIIKDANDYCYTITLDHLKRGKIPSFVHISNPFTLYNIKQWLKINNKPFESVSTTYTGTKVKLKWKCLKENCGEAFYMNWDNLNQGQNCSLCSGRH